MGQQDVGTPAGQHGRPLDVADRELAQPRVESPTLLHQRLRRAPSRTNHLPPPRRRYQPPGHHRPAVFVRSPRVSRTETERGTLARRGFADTAVAQRRLATFTPEQLDLLDPLAAAADPDLALALLVRLTEVRPGLLDRLLTAPRLTRQLIAILGASASLGQHLVAHPEHLDLLDGALTERTPAELRTELLRAVGADPTLPLPVASDPDADRLRLAYRAALLRIAARDICAVEPVEAVEGCGAGTVRPGRRHP